MNRWKCKTQKYGDILIYADTLELAQKTIPEATEIEPYTEMSYMQHINEIKARSEFVASNEKKELYKYLLNDGYVLIKLYKDGNEYYDVCEYQCRHTFDCVVPITWTMNDPKTFCEMYLIDPVKYERYSYRQYGQPKLSKPKELKNIKQNFSAEYIHKRCNCPCFCVRDDLWIQHKDFFSRSWRQPNDDFDKPTSYLLKKYFNVNKTEKFCYADCWGDIVLRDEAWMVFKNVKPIFQRELLECANENYVAGQIARMLLDEFIKSDNIAYRNLHHYISFELQWERFFEDVCKKYGKWLKESKNDVEK